MGKLRRATAPACTAVAAAQGRGLVSFLGLLRNLGLVLGLVLGLAGCGSDEVPTPPLAPAAEVARRVRELSADGELDVQDLEIGDAEFAVACAAPGLRRLKLGASRVSDRGLAALAGATELDTLWLGTTPAGDEAVPALTGLSRLRRFNAPRSRFSDAGLAQLAAAWPKLEQLRLGSPLLSDAGLAPLAGLRSLRFLHLLDSPIHDAGLEHVARIPALESFYADGLEVTAEGLTRLETARPGLHVH